MIKKLMSLSLIVSLGLILTGCQSSVILNVNEDDITIIEGQDLSIPITIDDNKGFEVSVSDDTVLEVKESSSYETVITALKEGEAIVTIASNSKSSLTKQIKVTVLKYIEINYLDIEITIADGDELDVVIDSNDPNLSFESSNKSVFVVDDSGKITAKEEGVATLVVASVYNPEITKEITVNVVRKIIITPEKDTYVLVVGDKSDLNITTNDDVIYESRNSDIVTISENGEMEALKFGDAIIRIKSISRPNFFIDIPVKVYKFTEGVNIVGEEQLIVGMFTTLTIDPEPLGAYKEVSWESTDESVVTVDINGVISGVAVGKASIIATSLIDDTVKDTFDVEVISFVVVDKTKTTGDTFDYEGVTLEYGVNLFSDFETAIDNSITGTKVLVAGGTYDTDITIDVEGLIIEGMGDASLSGVMIVAANNVVLRKLNFIGEASITNAVDISNVTIEDNTTSSITANVDSYLISLSGVDGVTIINNNFSAINHNGVMINDFIDGLILVKDNVFDTMGTALSITADREYAITSSINIIWNSFNNVDNAIVIDLTDTNGTDKAMEAFVRFNSIAFNQFGAKSFEGNDIDFTLNYWGSEILDYSNFENITESMLRGFYIDSESIMKESDFDPRIPIIIEILNPIEEIMIGEEHTIQYGVLPMDMVNPYIKFITNNPSVLSVSNNGQLTPNVSGISTITVRSGYNSRLNTTMTVNVVTTPGIELTTDHIYNDLLVGDEFNLTANVFPVASELEPVTYTTNLQSVATIDQNGHVKVLAQGVVVLRASLTNDPSVFTDYTIAVYNSLDTSSLLDYLTVNQVNFTTPHEWIAYGYQGNYNDKRYESVSRYYFDTVEINTSKLIPVFYGIRPGEPMDTLSESVRYNEDNIQWVVIHDTASSSNGSNALAHANYLYNNSVNEVALWVSWHYTIDDTNVYQHLPEEERGFHAGDGSTNPGEGSYLGGGNRNGVGIEMSINQDGDMFRTWQRTAKLTVDILLRHNLPTSQQTYHNDFSGKDCPRTLRNAGLIPLFEQFVDVEYYVRTNHPNALIQFTSNNPEYLDDHGRIVAMPERAMTVSYTISVSEDGQTNTRTFYSYLPGTVH
jgi:N-acetylmuramoyl-L-alanine amidase